MGPRLKPRAAIDGYLYPMPPTLRTSALLLAALAFPGGDLAAQCLAVDSPEAIEMRDSWRAMLVLGEAPGVWRWLGLTSAQKDSIILVDEPALCERAAKAIAEFRGVAVDDFTFALMRAGSGYLAQSSDLRINGMQTTYEFNGEMSLRLPRDTLASINIGGPSPPPTASVCYGPEVGFTKSIRGKIHNVLTQPRSQVLRDIFGLNGISADSAWHVSDEATCARALAAIKAHRGLPDEHVTMTLFRVGLFHWAESTWPRGGEFTTLFFLDSTATRVVTQH